MTKEEASKLLKQKQLEYKNYLQAIANVKNKTSQELKTQAYMFSTYLQQKEAELQAETKVKVLGLKSQKDLTSAENKTKKAKASEVASIASVVANGLLKANTANAKSALQTARAAGANAATEASTAPSGISPVLITGGVGVVILVTVIIIKKKRKK